MKELERTIQEMDFRFFGTGKHKIEAEAFLASKDAVLLDIRVPEETETIMLPLSHHCEVLEIPMHEIPARTTELPKDKLIGIFCSAGVRAAIIYPYLKSLGYNVKIILGGYPPFMDELLPGKLYKKFNP